MSEVLRAANPGNVPPPSPPSEMDGTFAATDILRTGSKVLAAQAAALAAINDQLIASYAGSPTTEGSQFVDSLMLLRNCVLVNLGKVVISGMGKSYKIAGKLVATLQSFGIPSADLHPCDALHGDLGNVHANDVLVMITASGSTPELRQLLPHLPEGLGLICITCRPDSALARISDGVISAAVPQEHSEESIYGLAAPTVTTTACLAVGDAMCIALHELLERDHKRRRANFMRWHPGGAIGLANHQEELMAFGKDVPQFTAPLHTVAEVELWRSCASCRVLIADSHVYETAELVQLLKEGNLHTAPVNGQRLDLIRRLPLVEAQKTSGLSVVVDGDNEVGLLLH